MALVTDIIVNDIGEVTNVIARKGKNGEIIKRHVSSVIPLLSSNECNVEQSLNNVKSSDSIDICMFRRKYSSTVGQHATYIRLSR